MLLSFKKDKAFINILSDLEIFLSEAADKLDINTKSLSTFTTVDNTRRYKNWNKIETVDTSNYIKYFRYDYEKTLYENQSTITLPWRSYDASKDLSVKIYYNGLLLEPTYDYVIRASTDSSSSSGEISGYVIDFGPYIMNHKITEMPGRFSILRTTTNLPKEIKAVDIAIDRYDRSITTAQINHALPWGSITDDDLFIEVYLDGVLCVEDNSAQTLNTYRLFNTYLLFSRQVTGRLTIIRYHKI